MMNPLTVWLAIALVAALWGGRASEVSLSPRPDQSVTYSAP